MSETLLHSAIIEFNVTISNIENIYCKNYNNMLLNYIKSFYEGKCYKSCYIKNINNIVRRSLPKIIRRDLQKCKFRIDVMVDVNIIKYDINDIVVGARVTKCINNTVSDNDINDIAVGSKISNFGSSISDNDSVVMCENDHSKILIKNNKILSSIKKDQIIPIIVGAISYNIYKDSILINAFPFIPKLKQEIIYKIDKLIDSDKEYLNQYVLPKVNLINNIKKDIIQNKKMENRWEYFNNLLYPYKKDLTENYNCVSISDYDITGFIVVNSKIRVDKFKIAIIANVEEGYVEERAINVYELHMINYIKYIDVVNNLTKIYLEDDIFNDHLNIFKLYQDNKYE